MRQTTCGTATLCLIYFQKLPKEALHGHREYTLWQQYGPRSGFSYYNSHRQGMAYPETSWGSSFGWILESVTSTQCKCTAFWVNDCVGEVKLGNHFVLFGCNCHIYLWDDSRHWSFSLSLKGNVFVFLMQVNIMFMKLNLIDYNG